MYQILSELQVVEAGDDFSWGESACTNMFMMSCLVIIKTFRHGKRSRDASLPESVN